MRHSPLTIALLAIAVGTLAVAPARAQYVERPLFNLATPAADFAFEDSGVAAGDDGDFVVGRSRPSTTACAAPTR